jgi:pre-mRNA-splicing factor CWC26
MSSKLDYLFKYTSGAADVGDGENEKRKRKQFKKEKKKKKKTTQSKSKSKSLATNLVDEDDFPEGAERHNDDDFDDNNFGVADDGPVVVAGGNVDAMLENNGDGDAMISRAPRGEWKAVGTATTNAGGGDGNGNGKEDSPHLQPKRRRQHDSSSDDDEDNRGDSSRRIDSSKRRQRYDSSEDEARSDDRGRGRSTSRRHDSSDDSNSERDRSKRGRRERRTMTQQRYDSEESDSASDRGHPSKRQQRRHDSDDDNSDDDNGESRKAKAGRMSSGHKAGLQHYKDFNKSEEKIRAKKHRDTEKMVDKLGMGETIYRDKDGRRTKSRSSAANDDNDGDGLSKEQAKAEETERLNQGKVQKEAREAKARELLVLQNSGFSRYRDDDRLEQELRNEIRNDDPMAKYAFSKQQKQSKRNGGGGQTQPPPRPVYKGPPPKPNRFGIKPGYRWDGNDRGNGFEDKLLAKKFAKGRKAEESYRWSTSDM